MELKSKIPQSCPSCSSRLMVQSLVCSNCSTTISGSFSLPLLARLTQEDQDFVLNFVKSSGSLKEMSKHFNLSYPSVRNMLDEIIARIEKMQADEN